ncbi:MAG: serine hydrolase domain-containing protein [Candidatus Eisenbacteria bacterium]|nr:serine hydrolase domain-containing protein [Candidatus Eisenbacteria bacterium]
MLRKLAVSAALALVAVAARGQEAPLPLARPETQKVSPAGLARLSATLRRDVDEARHAGVVALVARGGRIVHFEAIGFRDLEARLPMEQDTIVRIYSMSKIVTSVAVLMLMEDGRLNLDDPVDRYLPALANPRVFVGGTADRPILADAKRPVTIRHLLTHTSGYIYGSDGVLGQIWGRVKPLESENLDVFVEKVAKLPLRRQPGEEFEYSISTDILGALVQRVSGQPLGQFLEERIFAPLGIKDTGFVVPATKLDRVAKVYRRNAEGRLVVAEDVIPPTGRGMALSLIHI